MTYILDAFIGDVNFKPDGIHYNNNHLYWHRRTNIAPFPNAGIRKYPIPGLGSQNVAVTLPSNSVYNTRALGNQVLAIVPSVDNSGGYTLPGALHLTEGPVWNATSLSLTPPLPQYAGQQWQAFPTAYDRLNSMVGVLDAPGFTSPGYSDPTFYPGGPVNPDPWDLVQINGIVGTASTCFYAVSVAIANVINFFGYPGLVLPLVRLQLDRVEAFGNNLWVYGELLDFSAGAYKLAARLTLTPGTFGPSFGTATVQAVRVAVDPSTSPTDDFTGGVAPRVAGGKLYSLLVDPLSGGIGYQTPRRYNAATLADDNPPWAGFYDGNNGAGVKIADITPSLLNSYYMTANNYTAGGTTSTTAVYLIDGNLDTVVDGGTINGFAGATVAVDPNFDLWIASAGWTQYDYRIAYMIRAEDDLGWSHGLLAF
jgi:hypothetical protein